MQVPHFVSNLLKIKAVENTIYIGGDINLLIDLNVVKYKFPISQNLVHLHKGNFLIEKANYLKLTENISSYADNVPDTIMHCDALVEGVLEEIYHEPGNGAVQAILDSNEIVDARYSFNAIFQQICVCK